MRRWLQGAADGEATAVNRRHWMIATAAATLVHPATLAQAQMQAQARARRIGELNPFVASPVQAANEKIYVEAFRQRGWELERNLHYVKRIGPRSAEGWDDSAKELVAERVDLIVTYTDRLSASALRATQTIPVVALSAAPVELGFAQSLARPGGNFTGVSFQAHDENGRVLALLREIRPGLQRIGVPRAHGNPVSVAWFDSFEAVAAPAGMRIVALPQPAAAAGIPAMLDAAARDQVQALVLPTLPFLDSAAWQHIGTWAVRHGVVTRGSLLSRGEAVLAFGSNVPALLRLHVDQIDRVLRGANPGHLPIVQPTQWDTVINQRLARAVGWPAPTTVLLQATEVIE